MIYKVGDLIDDIADFKRDASVFVVGRDSANKYFTKSFYKIAEAADETEIYLYCSSEDHTRKCYEEN